MNQLQHKPPNMSSAASMGIVESDAASKVEFEVIAAKIGEMKEEDRFAVFLYKYPFVPKMLEEVGWEVRTFTQNFLNKDHQVVVVFLEEREGPTYEEREGQYALDLIESHVDNVIHEQGRSSLLHLGTEELHTMNFFEVAKQYDDYMWIPQFAQDILAEYGYAVSYKILEDGKRVTVIDRK